jgi:hypothetical protein
MIKLYRYGWIGHDLDETEAERETANFWIIKGRREGKRQENATWTWFHTPQEAIGAVIAQEKRRLAACQKNVVLCQDKLQKYEADLAALLLRCWI